MKNRVNVLKAMVTASILMQTAAHSQTDIGATLPNFDFSQGFQSWTKRTDTAAVYSMTKKNGDEPGTVSLTVGPNSPAKEKEAVYYNRTDLPKAEGYYRVTFQSKSALTAGRAGLSIISFGPENKILEHGVSGRRGLSPIKGVTDWSEHEAIFHVPAGTVMTVLQLEMLEGQGTVSFRNAKLESLEAASGAELFRAQGRRLIIEPFKQMPERKPQFPLKTQRMIYTAADVARARENIAKYPQAQKVLKEVTGKADKWVNWKDEDLLRLMPDARVPRAFDLSPVGCPVHGVEVFKSNMYPWILDTSHPFQVKCPIGGEKYPSNDYETYYKSGFKEKKGWDTAHVDDGWGWAAPNGERYWFVAYANHHMWFNEILPAIRDLSRAYLLTGDKRYAHKCAVMLYRLAEIYPSMDHAVQSRYGMIARDDGYVYGGKIVNHIWETMFADDYAEAYDNIWDSIDGNTELQKAHGKTGEQVRAFIEANLLEDAADAYHAFKIDGNYGMHQQALMLILLAREKMDNKALFRMLVDEPGSDLTHTGLRYALYNQIFRDGMPHESPYYNTHWLVKFAGMGELLKKGGYNLFEDPRMKALFDFPMQLVIAGRFTPDWGDTGYVMGDLQGLEPDVYRVAYDVYKEPRYLPWLAVWDQTGGNSYASFESLFREPVPHTKQLPNRRAVEPQQSRVMAGWGMGFLNNAKDNAGIAFTYGPHVGHFHWDYLNFDIFANGQKMMPDIGYPDAMNERVQELYTWGTNTVAHNTVVVDAGMQKDNNPGVLHSFGDSAFARSIDASAAVYPQAKEYRRSMVMVDVDETNSYAIDFFRVNGGKQHDYSLHGPPGEVSTEDGTWSEKKPGTLAGPNVKLGEIYDNAEMGAEGYPGTFSKYQGSGFQWLHNVQELEKGRGSILFKHVQDLKSQLRVQILPTTGDQQVFLADAWDRPRAKNNILKYVIVRRKAADAVPLKSTFVSVIEPFTTGTYVQSAQVISVNEGKTVSATASAVEVKRASATDVILSDTTARAKTIGAYGIETDAESAVVTFDAGGGLQRVFFNNGTYLRCKGQSFKSQGMEGMITSIDPKNGKVTVQLKENLPSESPAVLERMAFFTNQFRTAVHPLRAVSAKGKVAEFTLRDSLLVGKARLRDVGDKTVTSDTIMPFANIYQGVTMLKDNYQPVALVEKVNQGKFTLANAPKAKLAAGEDIWLSNLGVGDKLQVKPVFSWQAPAKPRAKAQR